MNPNMMRQIWSLIEIIQPTIPLGLDDESLVQWILRQFRSEQSLNSQEAVLLSLYLENRMPLIRDLAHERQLLANPA